jgi:hypothetical protein
LEQEAHSFNSLGDDADVRLAVHDNDNGLDGDWKVSRSDAAWLVKRVKALAERVVGSNMLAGRDGGSMGRPARPRRHRRGRRDLIARHVM